MDPRTDFGTFAPVCRAVPALVAPFFLATSVSTAAQALEIPDAALRRCVEHALDKAEGATITREDMASLTELQDCKANRLDGIEFATNLMSFSSYDGGIFDLLPLADLPSLRILSLHRNAISDLTPLTGILSLEHLYLSENPVSDLSPLASLASLSNLGLLGTYVTDLSPLSRLPSLAYLHVGETAVRDLPYWPPDSLISLDIGGTNVNDLTPLLGLTRLAHLSLGRLRLKDTDFAVLRSLPSLSSLAFAITTIDLEALSGLDHLRELNLTHSNIYNFHALANHTSLQLLRLRGTGLSDLGAVPFSALALQNIDLSDNHISELGPLLKNVGELRQIDLRANRFLSDKAVRVDIPALMARGIEVMYDPPRAGEGDVVTIEDPALHRLLASATGNTSGAYVGYLFEPVLASKLARVDTLSFSSSGITSLDGIEHATSLELLHLSGNRISDISPLADLPFLNILSLDGNPIGDFGPLVEMERLFYLALDNTSLREVPPLPKRGMQHLFLTDNSITNLEPLAWVGQRITFEQLWLSGNSISSLQPLTGSIFYLHLNDNEVADLAGLSITGLRELHIRNNALRDISPLLYARSLWMLDAQRNPLGEGALTVAETLRERGGAVLTGEPVPFLPVAGGGRDGLVRVINRSVGDGEVFIEAWDDAGVRFGPVWLRMEGRSVVHFDSTDLQSGNSGLGLAGIGPPTSGDWRLALTSPLDIEVLSYVRTADGFLTPMHDVAADATLPTLNPGSNGTRRSILRLVNRDAELAKVVVGGYDDHGSWEYMPRAVDVPSGQAWTTSAAALEGEHGVGDGRGKWRLRVPGWPWFAMSLLDSASGHLTNLSTVPDNVEELADGRRRHRVPLLPAGGGRRDGFVRVVNLGHLGGEVLIDAVDDVGASRGSARLRLDARQTVHFNAGDLAGGNANKGLDGAVGVGQGDWRLTLTSTLDLLVLSYVRTPDGYLAAMHDVVPLAEDGTHRMPFFNPGSNAEQLSKLRLLNHGGAAVSATVTGIDDAGQASTEARVNVPAGAALTVTAAELEAGGDGVSGRLGDGNGRWRLRLAADGPLTVMNLLESPEGHLANMSTVTNPD